MRSDFKLTEKSNVITLRILKSFLIVFIGFFFIIYFRHFPINYMYFLLASGIICMVLLFSLKSYKVIGKITFETNLIIVELTNRTIKLPFNTIRQIKFIIQGRKRKSYWPVIYQPIGVNRPDGTGNWMEIETDADNYKFDLFLQDSYDENSLEFQIKRVADSGIKIDKRKLPAILGDSI